ARIVRPVVRNEWQIARGLQLYPQDVIAGRGLSERLKRRAWTLVGDDMVDQGAIREMRRERAYAGRNPQNMMQRSKGRHFRVRCVNSGITLDHERTRDHGGR